MSVPLTITVLGSGGSGGVPTVACDCRVCQSVPQKPRNRRLRSSILVESATTRILVDFGPDFREQAIAHNIRTLDAVMLTHTHADHCHGIDDLRFVKQSKGLPMVIYGPREHLAELGERFHYTFFNNSNNVAGLLRPQLSMWPMEEGDTLMIGDIPVTAFRAPHGRINVLGYRFGDFSYLVDCHDAPPAALEAMRGSKLVMLEAYREEPFTHANPAHATVAQAVDWAQQIGAPETYLTDLSHHLDYDHLRQHLPAGIYPSHDGLKLEVK